MKITLRIEGKDKTFINDFVAAIHFKSAIQLNKEFQNKVDVSDVEPFDRIIEFVASVFEHQFSVEDVWNGLRTSDIQSEPMRIFNEVLLLGGLAVNSASEDLGNDQVGKRVSSIPMDG